MVCFVWQRKTCLTWEWHEIQFNCLQTLNATINIPICLGDAFDHMFYAFDPSMQFLVFVVVNIATFHLLGVSWNHQRLWWIGYVRYRYESFYYLPSEGPTVTAYISVCCDDHIYKTDRLFSSFYRFFWWRVPWRWSSESTKGKKGATPRQNSVSPSPTQTVVTMPSFVDGRFRTSQVFVHSGEPATRLIFFTMFSKQDWKAWIIFKFLSEKNWSAFDQFG